MRETKQVERNVQIMNTREIQAGTCRAEKLFRWRDFGVSSVILNLAWKKVLVTEWTDLKSLFLTVVSTPLSSVTRNWSAVWDKHCQKASRPVKLLVLYPVMWWRKDRDMSKFCGLKTGKVEKSQWCTSYRPFLTDNGVDINYTLIIV
jgi:hypothetical protein